MTTPPAPDPQLTHDNRPVAANLRAATSPTRRQRSAWSHLLSLSMLALALVTCSDEDHPLNPVDVCEEYCSRSMCPRDATTAQCQSACEAVHERCPRPADIFHRCWNSQPLANFICEDDGTTDLALGLCDVEERNFDDCVEGE